MLSICYIISNDHARVYENVLELHFTCEYMIINETTLSDLPRRMSESFRTQIFQSIWLISLLYINNYHLYFPKDTVEEISEIKLILWTMKE